MKKITIVLTIFLIFANYMVVAQEAQDFINDWVEAFLGFTYAENTALTILPILELSAGGRRSTMGNAYTAVSNDISFFESNPAASSILNLTELAFFHRNLIGDVNLDSVFFTQQQKKVGYGFGLKFLHFEFTSLDGRGNQLASAIPAEILFTANASYNFFANYYFTGIAAGINVKLAHRSIPSELYQHVISPESYPQNLVALILDFGLLSRFNFLKAYSAREKNFSIGISGLNFAVPVNGRSLPSELRAGISYKPFAFLTIAADLSYILNFVDISKSEGLAFSTGVNIQIVNFLGIQSGLELRGGNPRFSMGANIALDPLSFQISYTLDLSTSLRTFDNFSIGVVINFGDEGRAAIRGQVDEVYIEALIALSKGEYQKVIELCDSIIDPQTGLDPDFTPAQETRLLASTSLERDEDFINFEQNREGISP